MSELTDRMRTCAAYILDRKNEGDPWAAEIVALDAVDLLVEASNMLTVHEAVQNPQGEPMELLEPVAAAPSAAPAQASDATWVGPHDSLPAPRSPKACPQCGKLFDALIRKSGHAQVYCHSNCKAAAYRARR